MSVTIDRMLIRAPVGVVYAVLTDIDGWHAWWRGCRTTRLEGGPSDAVREQTHEPEHVDGGERHLVILGSPWRHRERIVRAHGWRHDAAVHLELQDRRGRAAGDVECWLETCTDGTIVHHVLRGVPRPRQREAHRRAVRLGLQDLKDHLEFAVEVALGRVP